MKQKVAKDDSSQSRLRVGVDSGGTFTDCVRFRGSRIEVLKVFSNPKAPHATLEAVQRLTGGEAALPPTRPTIIHGTTVGTNALLERRGARVALVTTEGFEDLIEIGRQNRARLYDLNPALEPPLIPRQLRFGIAERTSAEGKILTPVSSAALRKLAAGLKNSGAESIALCLLFSYANPANEEGIVRSLKSLGLPVSVSHQLLAEYREYERLSTTFINAYLAPRVGGYLDSLEREAAKMFTAGGIFSAGATTPRSRAQRPKLFVMQSSGGITTSVHAAREPVRTILSGPAGGVVATGWLTALAKLPKAISFDMGGTSTDVCLLDGRPQTTRETTVAGLPVAVPVLDVHTVGAGGGSLARMDAGGALRVGPQSAGAEPGPACYGKGGTQPTITDAHLILGRLDPDSFLGGGFKLDVSAAERSFDQFLKVQNPGSRKLGAWKAREELAAGIIAVGNAIMEKALRVISVERGFDPREFSLVCFGGAGGLHAAELARSLGLARVIVPQNPGAFSAIGVLLSDIVKDVSQSILLPIPIRAATVRKRASEDTLPEPPAQFLQLLQRRFSILESKAHGEVRRDGFEEKAARVERSVDARYQGQSYELRVPFSRGFATDFHRAHEHSYGYADPARPLEIVNLRLRLVIPTPKPPIRRERLQANVSALDAIVKTKRVWLTGRYVHTPLLSRDLLRPGMTFRGPAIVTEYSSTTVVPPGFTCRVDEYSNLVIANSRST